MRERERFRKRTVNWNDHGRRASCCSGRSAYCLHVALSDERLLSSSTSHCRTIAIAERPTQRGAKCGKRWCTSIGALRRLLYLVCEKGALAQRISTQCSNFINKRLKGERLQHIAISKIIQPHSLILSPLGIHDRRHPPRRRTRARDRGTRRRWRRREHRLAAARTG